MPEAPLIAVPHWRAPTWERTKFYYDALGAAGASYAIVKDDRLPDDTRGLLLTGGVDVNPRLYGEKRSPLTDKPNQKRDEHELRLLKMLAEGHSYKTAAATLGSSVHTVDAHMRKIYQKLEVHSKSEAVAKALRDRLVR